MRAAAPCAILLLLLPYVAPAARPTPGTSIFGSADTAMTADSMVLSGTMDAPGLVAVDAPTAAEKAPPLLAGKISVGQSSSGAAAAADAPASTMSTSTSLFIGNESEDEDASVETAGADDDGSTTLASVKGSTKLSAGDAAGDVAGYAAPLMKAPKMNGTSKMSAGPFDVDADVTSEPAPAPEVATVLGGSARLSFKNPAAAAKATAAAAPAPMEDADADADADAEEPADAPAPVEDEYAPADDAAAPAEDAPEPEVVEDYDQPLDDVPIGDMVDAELSEPAAAPTVDAELSEPAAAPSAAAPASDPTLARTQAPTLAPVSAPAPKASTAKKTSTSTPAPAPAKTGMVPAPGPAPAKKPAVVAKAAPADDDDVGEAPVEEEEVAAPAPSPMLAQKSPTTTTPRVVHKQVVPTMTMSQSDVEMDEAAAPTPAPAPASAKKPVTASAPAPHVAPKKVGAGAVHGAHATATHGGAHPRAAAVAHGRVHSPVRPRTQQKKATTSVTESGSDASEGTIVGTSAPEPPTLDSPQFKEETPMWSEPDTPDLPMPTFPQPSATANLNIGREGSFDLGLGADLMPGASASLTASSNIGGAPALADPPTESGAPGPIDAAASPAPAATPVQPAPAASSTPNPLMPPDIIGGFGRDVVNVTTKAFKLAGAVLGNPNNTVKAAAPEKVESSEDLHQLNEQQLQQVFTTGTAIMPGSETGSAACTGEGLTNFATQDTFAYGQNAPFYNLWKGKVFYTDPTNPGTTKIWNLLNNNNTVMAIGDATVLPGGMSPDNKDSLIINYNRSEAIIFRPLRDEIRKVGDKTYLGRAWVLNPVQGYKPSHPIPGTQPVMDGVEPALNATLMAALRTSGLEGPNSLPESQGGYGKYEAGEPFPVLWFAMDCEEDAVQRLHYSTVAQMLTGFARDAGWQPSNFTLPALNQRAGSRAAVDEGVIPDVAVAASPAVNTIREIATTGHADTDSPTLAAQAKEAANAAVKGVQTGDLSRRVVGNADNVVAGVLQGVQPAAGSFGTAVAGALDSLRPAGLPALPRNAIPGQTTTFPG